MAIREAVFQSSVIKEVEKMFPGCVVLKNDANYLPGIPDLLILYKNTWAMLEVKKGIYAARQPNQEHYVEKLDEMSFASFICPENKQEVLNELQRAFKIRRPTRLSQR